MNFSPLTRSYEALERTAFGPSGLDAARDAFVPVAAARKPRRVLLVGEGDGRFAQALVTRLGPDTQVDCLDTSRRMLARTRLRLRGSRTPVHYLRGDARSHPLPTAAYDLIATHFFFDNFTANDVETMLHRLDAAAAPGALWLHTDFAPCGPRARLWHAGLYAFFARTAGVRARQLTDIGPTMQVLGWRPEDQKCFFAGLVCSTCWRQ